MRGTRLLIGVLDDDPRADGLVATFEDCGFAVRRTSRSAEGEHLALSEPCDAVVFDPALTGPDFLPRLRRRLPEHALVAWLPAYFSSTVAELLEHGASEVLHGGMSARELVARVTRAAAAQHARPGAPLELAGLAVDPARGEVSWNGRRIPLSRRERDVLHVLAESVGKTVPRETLYRRVWGYRMARGDRSVDVNVKRLRAKLAPLRDAGVRIATQPGVGYRLELVHSELEAEQPVTAL